jgi:hypothetical protein
MANFQTSVGVQPAPALAGDFANGNPRFSVPAGPGGLIAGPNGLTIGRFAWISYASIDGDGAPAAANNNGAGPIAGFVHRDQRALITTYLGTSSNVVPAGFDVTVHNGGDFWVKNEGTTQALPGQYAYANCNNGAATFGASLSASATGSIAANTGSFTGSINGNILTISAVSSGVVVKGGLLTGTNVATGTRVLSQVSGATGGVGTYIVSIAEQTVASTTISETYGTFTAASGLSGLFGPGNVLAGTGVTAGTTITDYGTGAGGLGTYIVDTTQTASSTVITGALNVLTKWVCMSPGLPGELVKISSHPLG